MNNENEKLIFEEEDTQKGRFLTFNLGDEAFGLEIKHVTEIIGVQPITLIPEVPNFVKGIINLRGKIIPVIDVRLKFKKEAIKYDDRTCIIVVDINNISAGFIVDNVSEVLTISEENIVPPPEYKIGFQNNYIKNIGKTENGVKLLLDCQKMLNEDELDIVEAIAM
ncbi:MAG: purine-binding chemotaxis protein CheW [Clostridia bacterium]|nr:purine-binding chemotaxis protein CheW [Clostridia bacterium]